MTTEANVAVLIDYENVGLGAIQYLFDRLSNVGRVIIRRAYGDWSVQRNKQDQLLELGIESIHQYHSNKSGKNSSDIRLVIEAIDLLYSSPIDTFVIVSSDSDFVPLVSKLRSSGKSVIVAGRLEATSPTLRKSCDEYIPLDGADKRNTPSHSSNSARRRSPRRGGPVESKPSSASSPAFPDPKSLLERAMDASIDVDGMVVGSKLYQTMRRIEPSFNFKDYKHRLFTQFLDAHDDLVEVTRPADGSGDVIVRLRDSRTDTKPSSTPARNGRSSHRQQPQLAKTAPNTESRPDRQEKSAQHNAQSSRRLLGSTGPGRTRRQHAPETQPTPQPAKPVQDDTRVLAPASQSDAPKGDAQPIAEPRNAAAQETPATQPDDAPKGDTQPAAEPRNAAAQDVPATQSDDAPKSDDAQPVAERRKAAAQETPVNQSDDASEGDAQPVDEPHNAASQDAPANQSDAPKGDAQPVDERRNTADKAQSSADANGDSPKTSWELSVNDAWSKRNAARIGGRAAAGDAAKILGTKRLSDSPYPTLEKLLTASMLLQLNWRREGNVIIRK